LKFFFTTFFVFALLLLACNTGFPPESILIFKEAKIERKRKTEEKQRKNRGKKEGNDQERSDNR
jgi:hypothetical protein